MQQQWNWNAIFSESHGRKDVYWKSCQWSPDGSALLGSDSSHSLSLLQISEDDQAIAPLMHWTLPECVYDTAWYPLMDSAGDLSPLLYKYAIVRVTHTQAIHRPSDVLLLICCQRSADNPMGCITLRLVKSPICCKRSRGISSRSKCPFILSRWYKDLRWV